MTKQAAERRRAHVEALLFSMSAQWLSSGEAKAHIEGLGMPSHMAIALGLIPPIDEQVRAVIDEVPTAIEFIASRRAEGDTKPIDAFMPLVDAIINLFTDEADLIAAVIEDSAHV